MKANVGDFLKAINLLLQFLADYSAQLVALGQNPTLMIASLNAVRSSLMAKEGAQENAKVTQRNATLILEGEVNGQWTAFCSLIDLLAGALGKGTPAGKQVRKIRAIVRTGSGGSSHPSSSSTSGSGGSSSSSSSSSSGGSSSSSS